jgi:anti-anti-sigma factor
MSPRSPGGRAVSEPFRVATERSPGTQRIIAAGELDIATVPQLEEAFDAALDAGAERILVDLGALTFIDSTGLRLLIRMHERCPDERLAIRSTPVVDRLLQVTGLLDQLPLLPEDPAEAS